MNRLCLASAVAIVSVMGAQGAQASIITYTYTGVVTSGLDSAGLFGAVGANLSDQMFRVVETFDTSKAANIKPPYTDNKTYSEGEGGSSIGQPDFATSKVTIGGTTVTISPVTYGEAYSLPYHSEQQDYTLVSSQLVADGFYKEERSEFNAYSALLSYDYTQPGVYTTSNTTFDGDFSYQLGTSSSDYSRYTYANFAVSKLVISNVPLPASAPMFGAALLGLGLVGCYGRRLKALRRMA